MAALRGAEQRPAGPTPSSGLTPPNMGDIARNIAADSLNPKPHIPDDSTNVTGSRRIIKVDHGIRGMVAGALVGLAGAGCLPTPGYTSSVPPPKDKNTSQPGVMPSRGVVFSDTVSGGGPADEGPPAEGPSDEPPSTDQDNPTPPTDDNGQVSAETGRGGRGGGLPDLTEVQPGNYELRIIPTNSSPEELERGTQWIREVLDNMLQNGIPQFIDTATYIIQRNPGNAPRGTPPANQAYLLFSKNPDKVPARLLAIRSQTGLNIPGFALQFTPKQFNYHTDDPKSWLEIYRTAETQRAFNKFIEEKGQSENYEYAEALWKAGGQDDEDLANRLAAIQANIDELSEQLGIAPPKVVEPPPRPAPRPAAPPPPPPPPAAESPSPQDGGSTERTPQRFEFKLNEIKTGSVLPEKQAQVKTWIQDVLIAMEKDGDPTLAECLAVIKSREFPWFITTKNTPSTYKLPFAGNVTADDNQSHIGVFGQLDRIEPLLGRPIDVASKVAVCVAVWTAQGMKEIAANRNYQGRQAYENFLSSSDPDLKQLGQRVNSNTIALDARLRKPH